MNYNEELYSQYDFLLPSRYEGGFLVLALYEKIKSKEIPEYFTDADIGRLLQQLAVEYKQGVWQTDRIIRNLNYFYIKGVPDQFGKYYLSDYASRVVEMIKNKLENPYKNYPLKDTFEKYFSLKDSQVNSLNDLVIRYGRDFVAPHKSIIENHLDGLQDELEEAHQKLTDILVSEELSAIQMVHQFVDIFTKFGERAEDISSSISSKERFMRALSAEVDKFYSRMMESELPQNEDEQILINQMNAEWVVALGIYKDLSNFFDNVDIKLSMVHKQILYATEKLYELQENFSSRSNFRLAVKRLLNVALNEAEFSTDGVKFRGRFPMKNYPYERSQFFYPDYFYFNIIQQSQLIDIPRDELYEAQQLSEIEHLAQQSEKVNELVDQALTVLEIEGQIQLNDWIIGIYSDQEDMDLAMHAGFELIQRTVSDKKFNLDVKNELGKTGQMKLKLWKITITKENILS